MSYTRERELAICGWVGLGIPAMVGIIEILIKPDAGKIFGFLGVVAIFLAFGSIGIPRSRVDLRPIRVALAVVLLILGIFWINR
jgi:hypothetical protein